MSTASAGHNSNPTSAMPVDRHAVLHKIFVCMDADGSDYVDAMEFKSIFSEIGEKRSDQQLKEIDAIRGRGDKDGRLSTEEFCGFMLEHFADRSDAAFTLEMDVWFERLANSKRKLLLRRVFERMDTDKSGGVSMVEFKALGEEEVGAEMSNVFFRWIEQCTGNGDGMLTADEWVPFVLEMEADTSDEDFQAMVDEWQIILKRKRRVLQLRQVYLKMDADNSGEVDLAEFANLREGTDFDEALPHIFQHLDDMGNADGMLSCNEWIDGMSKIGEDMSDEDFEEEVAKWVRLLTDNQRAIWRKVFAKGNALSFVSTARAAGATHILFVHHGACQASEVSPNVHGTVATGHEFGVGEVLQPLEESLKAADAARPLTNQGTAQCMVAREEWFGRLPVRSVILSSPAVRAKQTALHMAGRADPVQMSAGAKEPDSHAPLVLVEKLHPCVTAGTGSCEELFAQKGFVPLRSYLDAEMGEQAFGLYAEAACKELAASFRAHGKGREKATYVSIFGQAVYINAIAHAVACAAGAPTEVLDPLLDFDLGEAEGILIPLFGGPPIQHLKRPL